MLKKQTICSIIILVFLASSITSVAAQDASAQLIELSDNQLTFYGEQDATNLTRTIKVIGVANNTTVELFLTDLYSNSSGKTIPFDNASMQLHPFNITKNDEKSIDLILDTSKANAGTYQGTIIVTATSGENITTTNIKVKAEITIAGLSINQIIVLGTFIGLIIATFVSHQIDRWILVLVFSALTIIVWLYILVTSMLGDITSIVTTILMVPFVAYMIDYVKNKRAEIADQEKVSRGIRDKGLEDDIGFFRTVIGELTSHCASFRPNLYEKQDKECCCIKPGTDFRILYNKSGLLSRKVWDESCKQGRISNFPMLELEKYYDFIDLYNKHYKCAMKLTTDKKYEDVTSHLGYLKWFEKFRKAYAELETVLFVDLTYYLGLSSKICVAPLKNKYPRITRTVLKSLIDYKVLDPSKYNSNENAFTKRIYNYELSHRELTKIMDDVYKPDKTRQFYGQVAKDFQEKYVALKEAIRNLPKLPEDCEEKETKTIDLGIKGKVTLELNNKDEKPKKE